MIMFCIGVLAGGIMTGRIGSRLTLLIASVYLSGGFVLSAFAKGLLLIYVAYGGLCGGGVGLAYNAILSTTMTWFKGREGMASGIMLMGYGLGGMILGTLSARMMEILGWRTTFVILGIVTGAWTLLVALALKRNDAAAGAPADAASTDSTPVDAPIDIPTKDVLRKPYFWLHFLWAITMSSAGLAVINTAAPLAQAVTGRDATYAAAVAGIVSLANGAGRVIIGFFYDRFKYWRTLLFIDGLFVAAGVTLLCCWQLQSLPLRMAGFLLIGMSYGCLPPTNFSIMADFYGPTYYSVNVAMINMNVLFAACLGPLVGGLDGLRFHEL